MDDGTIPLLIIGMMMGTAITLLIQAYGRRKVRKALAAMNPGEAPAPRGRLEKPVRDRETEALAARLAVLEKIVTDRPLGLAEEIEGLRR